MNAATLAIAAVLAASTTVHAQPSVTPYYAPAPSAADPGPPPELKSPATATLLSLAGALIPTAMIFAPSDSDDLLRAGLLLSTVGPSVGHWYAGKYVTAGLAMRGAGGLLVLAGFASTIDCVLQVPEVCRDNDGAEAMLIGGVLIYGAGMVYDVATAGSSARDYNREHAVRVAPAMINSVTGPTAGVGVTGTF